jgi:hypothetical protein
LRSLASPLIVGLCFLALVPIYATIYALLPAGSFFDANLRREAAHHADERRLLAALTHSLRSTPVQDGSWLAPLQVKSVPTGPESYVQGRWRVSRQSLDVLAIRFSDSRQMLLQVGGDIVGTASTATGAHFPDSNNGIKVEQVVSSIDFSEWVMTQQPVYPSHFHLGDPDYSEYQLALSDPSAGSTSRQPYQPPLAVIFRSPDSRGNPGRENGQLRLSRTLAKHLVAFSLADDGDPQYASDLWSRMAYLSGTVITTLGFGDVTPVSDAARWWVTSETVLGLILVGLFLNALGWVIVRRQGDPRRER